MNYLATLALAAALCLPFALHAQQEPVAKPAKAAKPEREQLEKLAGFEAMPAPPEDFNLHIDVQIIALPEVDTLALLPQLKDPAKAEQACAALQTMLTAGRAKLIGWPMFITKPGLRATAENIDEFRYAIEFSPTAIKVNADNGAPPRDAPPRKPAPPTAAEPEAAAPSEPTTPSKAEPTPPQLKDPTPPEILKSTEPVPTTPAPPETPRQQEPPHKQDGPRKPGDPQVPNLVQINTFEAIPTTFETRNVGQTLEVEAALDTATMRLDLSLSVQHVYFAGMDRTVVESQGRKFALEQPRFRTNKVQTNFTTKSGDPVLIGHFRHAAQPGYLELFILRATAKSVK